MTTSTVAPASRGEDTSRGATLLALPKAHEETKRILTQPGNTQYSVSAHGIEIYRELWADAAIRATVLRDFKQQVRTRVRPNPELHALAAPKIKGRKNDIWLRASTQSASSTAWSSNDQVTVWRRSQTSASEASLWRLSTCA